ncbi:MAG: hypothetical protein ACR2FE_03045 [Aeromicrobium sp.]
MKTHEKPEARPLFPLPVSETFPEGHQRMDRDGETVDLYGYCAPWCEISEDMMQPSGATVTEHGVFCEARTNYVDGRVLDGRGTYLTITAVKPYLHGQYEQSAPRGRDEPLVRLSTYDPDDLDARALSELFITAEMARKLARALGYVADTLDGFDRPMPRHR